MPGHHWSFEAAVFARPCRIDFGSPSVWVVQRMRMEQQSSSHALVAGTAQKTVGKLPTRECRCRMRAYAHRPSASDIESGEKFVFVFRASRSTSPSTRSNARSTFASKDDAVESTLPFKPLFGVLLGLVLDGVMVAR